MRQVFSTPETYRNIREHTFLQATGSCLGKILQKKKNNSYELADEESMLRFVLALLVHLRDSAFSDICNQLLQERQWWGSQRCCSETL